MNEPFAVAPKGADEQRVHLTPFRLPLAGCSESLPMPRRRRLFLRSHCSCTIGRAIGQVRSIANNERVRRGR